MCLMCTLFMFLGGGGMSCASIVRSYRGGNVFITNTWGTLGRISEPQGCHYTVFLTSATFPSHPKTHDRSENKEYAALCMNTTQRQTHSQKTVTTKFSKLL